MRPLRLGAMRAMDDMPRLGPHLAMEAVRPCLLSSDGVDAVKAAPSLALLRIGAEEGMKQG